MTEKEFFPVLAAVANLRRMERNRSELDGRFGSIAGAQRADGKEDAWDGGSDKNCRLENTCVFSYIGCDRATGTKNNDCKNVLPECKVAAYQDVPLSARPICFW